MTDQDEILMALGAVEQTLDRVASELREALARVEALLRQIALGMGVKPP